MTVPPDSIALLSLGSSIEPRHRYLKEAVTRLGALGCVTHITTSTTHETLPVGGAAHNLFLNMALRVAVRGASPHEFLHEIQAIEHTLGRDRAVRWGDRTIDIDIVLWDDLVVTDDDLVVPHPRMCERRFVLAPLAEIAPDTRHPLRGVTIRELLCHLENT